LQPERPRKLKAPAWAWRGLAPAGVPARSMHSWARSRGAGGRGQAVRLSGCQGQGQGQAAAPTQSSPSQCTGPT
jgi:hypothetical protein